MTRLRRRERSTLEEVYDRHSASAVRFAYLMTGDVELAQDLVQEAFVRLFARFRNRNTPDGINAYLRRTIVNLSSDHWRRKRVERSYETRERGLARPDRTLLPDIEGREELWTALERLPARQRAVLVLRHFDDLSEQQTAEVLGCSVGAVKALASRGLEGLRTRLEGVRDA